MKAKTTSAVIAIFAAMAAGSAYAAPASATMTAEQFAARCKTDARFCKVQIMAAEALLEKDRKACVPASVSKDDMAERVQDTVTDVLEEDPDTFKSGPYRQMVDQIISYLWPCEPIS